MREVAIKYNPYMVKTEITIDGMEPAGNSWFVGNSGKRLQEWVDDLPQKLVDEENDAQFHIKFHGTTPDMEDVRDSLDFAAQSIPDFSYTLEHIPAKEVADKEMKIQEVFEKIQSIKDDEELAEDFEKLTSPDVVDAFNTALNNEFEVFVVATMSAGKSTLINAMLGRKLMPSKQEACTALITRIKDSDSDEENAPFRAEAFGSIDGNDRLETIERLRLADMDRLNGCDDVRRIEVTGDIPFVASDEVALVLIDTPGPNNARTRDHGKVQRKMLDNKAKPLILYVMTGEFGTDDDVAVFRRVADSMSKGGKQARDRFLFVVNKLDDRKKEDKDLKVFLQNVRKHLEENGIPDPNIFPAGALPAMNIRLLEKKMLDDEDDIDETEVKIRKFNRNPRLHFEEAAPLPRRVQAEIDKELQRVKDAWDGEENENPREALIHTGIPSVEAAIRLYVEKYARTAKIKTLVDTFMGRLESLVKLTELEKEIATNTEERENLLRQINEVREKAAEMEKEVKDFENRVDQAVEAVVAQSDENVGICCAKLETKITSKYSSRAEETIEMDEVDDEVRSMQRFANRLQDQFKEELDTLIKEQLMTTGERLVAEYRDKLNKLGSDITLSSSAFNFKPLELMAGELDDKVLSKAAIKSLEREEQVKTGEEWVENTNKKWWKPWTWGEEKGYWRTTYKTRHFICIGELANTYFEPVQKAMRENAKEAKNFAKEQSQNISIYFKGVFAKLDQQLQGMMDNLEKLATDKEITEEELKRILRKKEWIKDIEAEIKTILEI